MQMTLWITLSVAWLTNSPQQMPEPSASPAKVESFENELEAMEAEWTHAKASLPALDEEWTRRADDIRMEAIYLRVKMRKHVEAGGDGTGSSEREISEVRQAVAAFRDDLQQALREHVEWVTLPAETVFSVRLLAPIGTETAQVGDSVSAHNLIRVTRMEKTLIPEGALLHGAVELADRPGGRTDRGTKLILAFGRLEVDGEFYDVTATVVGGSQDLETGLGSEKKKMGIGAGIGGVVGAVIGGATGAIAGVILGGSGAVLATEGKDVELPVGTVLRVRLDRELELPVVSPTP